MFMLVAGIAATLALSAGDNTIRPTPVNTRCIFTYERRHASNKYAMTGK